VEFENNMLNSMST